MVQLKKNMKASKSSKAVPLSKKNTKATIIKNKKKSQREPEETDTVQSTVLNGDQKTVNGVSETRSPQQKEPEVKEPEQPEVKVEAEPIAMAPEPSTSKPKKRKAEAKPQEKKKNNTSVKPKSKRQKVVLELPSLSSISGKVFVIGENDVGQLGFGEEVEVKKRPALLELPHSIADVAAGGMHSVCLTESGEVITFGCNDEGALGRITTEEGSECIPRKVEIPEKVIQISAGDSHTAALSESGQVYLWGNFRSGDGPMGLTADGAKQVKPIKILNTVTIVKISSGTEHLVCLSSDGLVYTLGCGENGQLGRISERRCRDGGRKGRAALLDPAVVLVANARTPVPIQDIWAGSYTTFMKAQETGLIYAFGLNNYNHLGYENERVRFVPKQVASFNDKAWLQITGGQHHTLALDSSGLVFSLGRKEYGRLGLGENCEEKAVPTVVSTLERENCTFVSCGNCVSFSLTEDGSVWSWGMGTNHQLGHGNDDDSCIPKCVEGNFSSNWKAHKVSGGGQHTLILATPKQVTKTKKK